MSANLPVCDDVISAVLILCLQQDLAPPLLRPLSNTGRPVLAFYFFIVQFFSAVGTVRCHREAVRLLFRLLQKGSQSGGTGGVQE